MPLTHNEKAAVTAQMLSYISDMNTESVGALSEVIDALNLLLNDQHTVVADDRIATSVRYIREYMSPELGFSKPENRPEFLALCQNIISERSAFYAGRLSVLTDNVSTQEILPTAVAVPVPENPVLSVVAHPVVDAQALRFFQVSSTTHQQASPSESQPIRMARYYALRNCAAVHGITLSKFEDGSVGFSIALRSASDNNYDIFERTVGFFSRHNPDLPRFIQSVAAHNIPALSAHASAKGFLEVLGFIFTAIEQFDGENHVSEAKKREVRESLEQFLEPIVQENSAMPECVMC